MNSKILYVCQTGNDKPSILEDSHQGAFADALQYTRQLAQTTAGFLLGQVLDPSGKVLANVCQGGVLLNHHA